MPIVAPERRRRSCPIQLEVPPADRATERRTGSTPFRRSSSWEGANRAATLPGEILGTPKEPDRYPT